MKKTNKQTGTKGNVYGKVRILNLSQIGDRTTLWFYGSIGVLNVDVEVGFSRAGKVTVRNIYWSGYAAEIYRTNEATKAEVKKQIISRLS